MLCTRNDEVIVAVFFDVKTCVTTSTENQNHVRDFLHQVGIRCHTAFRGRGVMRLFSWYPNTRCDTTTFLCRESFVE